MDGDSNWRDYSMAKIVPACKQRHQSSYNSAMNFQINLPNVHDTDDATVAAIVAALTQLLAEHEVTAPPAPPARSAWAIAGIRAAHGLPSARTRASWSQADRAE
jgi:hypothetical protein